MKYTPLNVASCNTLADSTEQAIRHQVNMIRLSVQSGTSETEAIEQAKQTSTLGPATWNEIVRRVRLTS